MAARGGFWIYNRPPVFRESAGRALDMEAFKGNERIEISGLLLIALHLVPGLTFAGFFFVLSRMFIRCGLTGYLAVLVTIPLCLVPIEIGVPLLWSARVAGKRSLLAAIGYRQRGPVVDYVVLALLLFICWGVLSIVIAPISQYLETHLSGWLPSWATLEALITDLANSSPAQRPIALGLGIVLSGFVASVAEELYFRGFLLPKMEHWGWVAPVVNSLLFAVGHFYFPGNVPGVFVAFVPISFVVMVKKNWRIGAIVHILFNLLGVFSVARLIT
jgi:membrane protease YdiL (CAAX protease family)